MKFKRMGDVALAGKRVFIRSDLNVPLAAGEVADDTRIRASLSAIRAAMSAGARVMVTSHLGRPKEGAYSAADSLQPVARRLALLLGTNVPLARDWVDGFDPMSIPPGGVALLENCRFNKGEKADDEPLARRLAALCDIYVNDAFGTAHRAEATTHGMARFAPIACAGPLLAAELDALGQALAHPKRPLVAIVAGSKVSTKLGLLSRLAEKVDGLIVGGGILNTFLLAAGARIGKSLAEPDLAPEATRVMAALKAKGGEIPLPVDVVTAKRLAPDAASETKMVRDVEPDDLILDIGPKTAAALAQRLAAAGTIVWNGPVGVFEIEQFSHGTRTIAEAIANAPAFSIAGGGDTVAAINKFVVADRIDYISTAGGAFLEFIEGKELPAVAALEERAER